MGEVYQKRALGEWENWASTRSREGCAVPNRRCGKNEFEIEERYGLWRAGKRVDRRGFVL
jgi:hypothetical protein